MSEVTVLVPEMCGGTYAGALTGPLVPLSGLGEALIEACPTAPDAHAYLVVDLTAFDYVRWTDTPMGLVFMAQMLMQKHTYGGKLDDRMMPLLEYCAQQLRGLADTLEVSHAD